MRAAVDSLTPILLEHLAYLPESVPVVLYLLDNRFFKALNENGDLSSITRSQEDRAFYFKSWRENKDFGPDQNAQNSQSNFRGKN